MRILLATDLSPRAQSAQTLVKGMALPAGSQVRLVHAIEPITTVAMFAPSALLTITDAAEAEARTQLRAAVRSLEREGIDVTGVVGYGRAADVVIDESAAFGPDLIVIGSRGRGGLATSVLGSVSAEVVDRAACPVAVARSVTLERIVLAEDGSPTAAVGARVIADLAPLAKARVHVVSVVDVPFPVVLADPTGTGTALEAYRAYEESMPTLRASYAAFARERAQALEKLGVTATSEQREGDAASELIAAAREHGADCIVVGSRGQTGLKRLVLGSVARDVLLHAPCSVLIAHPAKPIEREPAQSVRSELATR
ncbi:MAG TPA: universal stress protein [Candidatus Limnocylindria bacterium]|nr:universal stress protein [Candidatus Limnocylindria bacterium]